MAARTAALESRRSSAKHDALGKSQALRTGRLFVDGDRRGHSGLFQLFLAPETHLHVAVQYRTQTFHGEELLVQVALGAIGKAGFPFFAKLTQYLRALCLGSVFRQTIRKIVGSDQALSTTESEQLGYHAHTSLL